MKATSSKRRFGGIFARKETLSGKVDILIKQIAPSALIATGFTELFKLSTAAELLYMQPFLIADTWGVDRRLVLKMFIDGTHKGLFLLRWVDHCPKCNAAHTFNDNIDDLRPTANCGICSIEFSNVLDENVEVVFSASPKLVAYPDRVIEAMQQEMMKEIQESGTFDAGNHKVTAKDVITIAGFFDLFENQSLSLDHSLKIASLPFLFTDIKSSTRIYEVVGDVDAYRVVREHFSVLFKHIEANNGTVVKTIGDAVMAVFLAAPDALTAALNAMDEFPQQLGGAHSRIEVKMGLHNGPCLAVTLNKHMDYFGGTVNQAARVQSVAEGGEIVLTQTFLQHEGVKSILRPIRDRIKAEQISLRGIEQPVRVYRISARR